MPKQFWHEGNKIPYKVWSSGFPSGTPSISAVYQDRFLDGNLSKSQGNAYHKLGKTNETIGGDFSVVRKYYENYSSLGSGSPMHFSNTSNPMSGGAHYYGPVNAINASVNNTVTSWPVVGASTDAQLRVDGTFAISRCIPTNPMFSLTTFLGELREGIPKAVGAETWQSRTRRARSAGGEYLNVEFGWKPLVSDVRKFAHAVKDREAILRKYEANSGKKLHRRFDFPFTLTTTHSEQGSPSLAPSYVNGYVKSAGKRSLTVTTRNEKWFEGCFTYYLPPAGTAAGYEARANKLLGTRLTPETLWELTPWSWAADWVANTGTIMHNVSQFAADGLTMPYAYIMEKKTVTNEYVYRDIEFFSYPGRHTLRQTFTTEVKTRRVASPFGFGFNWDGLTPRQGAIVAALGLSRGGKRK